jgi:hypothetical protein
VASTRTPAPDLDATVAAGRSSDPDATFVAGMQPLAPPPAPPAPPAAAPAGNLDATFVAGAFDLDATIASRSRDLDATVAARSLDLDRTIAPGSHDLDATFVAGITLPSAAAPPPSGARLTAGADLRITTASPDCRTVFNVAPDTLVGRPLGDVLADRLRAAAAGGPAELTFVVERAPADRSLIVTLKAAQAVEAVS